MNVWAGVFVTTRQPRRPVQAMRAIEGVVKADALPAVAPTDAKVARWID